MAHKKGQGSTKNGRDSNPQYRGIKLYGGDHYQIRNEAMAPVLLTGDWVLAKPLEPDAIPPRGTIVAYQHPGESDTILVSRVIGDRSVVHCGCGQPVPGAARDHTSAPGRPSWR